ncbi:MAG TPA: DUF5723 family protein [Candidatus Kapabacteria bacterium]|nr:DUF5723 family protein [Candidatus Kapabacteria bacterium]
MTMIRIAPIASLLALCTIVTTTRCAAQDRLDPVAMGKARASVASVRGIGAIASNPGALDLPATHPTTLDQPLTVSLYDIGGTVGSTYLSSSDFRQIFGSNAGWPDQDARARLGVLLQDERLFASGANNLVTLRYHTPDAGTFGLHYGHRAYARLNFPDDFSRVIAKGELLLDQYRFINRGVGGTWFTELGLSYGKAFGGTSTPGWFPQVGVGATARLLNGVAQFEVDENSFIAVDQQTLRGTRAYIIQGGYVVRSAQPDRLDPANAFSEFEAGLFPATSGTGLGLNVGISGVLYRMYGEGTAPAGRNAVYFGMALEDVGSIRWKDVAYERTQTGISDTLFNGTLSNDQFRAYQGTLRRTDGYSTNLPMVFRAGLAVDVGAYARDLAGTLIVDLEGELPLNDEPGNSPNPRLALGGDWAISNSFALRAGLSGGGVSGFGIGLGIGYRPASWLAIDIGSSEVNSIFTGNRADLAFRLSAGF